MLLIAALSYSYLNGSGLLLGTAASSVVSNSLPDLLIDR